MKGEVVLGLTERAERIPYESGKVIENWARTFECRPERFYAPSSEEQVIEIVNLARQQGKTIRVVGAGHSPSDILCSSEWMMSLDHLNKVLSHDLDRLRITVQAGMRMYDYIAELEKRGWCMDNLGSISEQSLAGAISTCTHGSSLVYGVISTQVEEVTLVLADGTTTTCSLENDPDLFKAALVSLGSLGIIIRLKMKATPKYHLEYTFETFPLSRFLTEYDTIWTSAPYVRAWWGPYTRQVVVWRANRTETAISPAAPVTLNRFARLASHYELGRRLYELSLYCLKAKPSLLPQFEKLLFRNSSFPVEENVISQPIVGNAHQSLQMDCYFSQYVDEWAVPLESGVVAISRLDRWLNEDDSSPQTGIPMPNNPKVYVHAPIEIRVCSGKGDHAFLSPARDATPVIWIGVIMYRPYFTPTQYRRYFSAYEHLMASLGGKPHWAKQHGVPAAAARRVFGQGLQEWLHVREQVDPLGVFVNGFVKRHLLGTSRVVDESTGVGVLDGESGRLYKRFRAVL